MSRPLAIISNSAVVAKEQGSRTVRMSALLLYPDGPDLVSSSLPNKGNWLFQKSSKLSKPFGAIAATMDQRNTSGAATGITSDRLSLQIKLHTMWEHWGTILETRQTLCCFDSQHIYQAMIQDCSLICCNIARRQLCISDVSCYLKDLFNVPFAKRLLHVYPKQSAKV